MRGVRGVRGVLQSAQGELIVRRATKKSHRVGRATLTDGVVTTAYRAVVAFTCVQCAREIASGELFSRLTRRTQGGGMSAPTTDPICATCRPLRLDDADGDAGGTADEMPTDSRT